jgi:hypothetical protein
MQREETKTITILVTTGLEDNESKSKSIFPSRKPKVDLTTERAMVVAADIAVETLGDSLADFVKDLERIVEKLPDTCGAYNLDSLTFSLSVNGSGKISLIGEVAAGVTAGIVISLKKHTKQTEN